MTARTNLVLVTVIVAAGAILGVSAWKAYELRSELSKTALRAAELEARVASLTQELAAVRAASSQPVVAASTEVEPASQQMAPEVSATSSGLLSARAETAEFPAGSAEERRAVWRSRQAVSDIEEHLALSPEEKSRLSEALRLRFAAGETVGRSLEDEVLVSVVGEERAGEYRKLQKEAEERSLNERLGREAIVLSRKLSLTPEQEARALAVLKEAETVVMPRNIILQGQMREAMANHFAGEEGKERLKEQYDQITSLQKEIKSERDKFIFEQLGSSLSDEQKNALLAEQAAGASGDGM